MTISSSRPPSAHLGWKILLSSAVGTLGLLMVETGLRVGAHWRNQETIHAALSELVPPSHAPDAGMSNIVRLSENDRIVYELQPDLEQRTFRDTLVSTDSNGFRMSGALRENEEEAVTIVGIGDSIMFGHGIEGEQTYLAHLERMLRESHPRCAWRVINSAVPGYNTVMEVETLRSKCLSLEPDLVILHLVGNDYSPPTFVQREEDVLTWDRSYLLHALRRWNAGLSPRPPRSAAYLPGDWWLRHGQDGTAVVPEAYHDLYGRDALRGALDELAALSAGHGFDVLVFTNHELQREHEMIVDARARGFQHVSLTDDLRNWLRENNDQEFSAATYRASALVVGAHNAHPSALQHRMAARRLLQSLGEMGWLDGSVARCENP